MENPDIDRPAVHIGFPFFAALFVASFFGAPFAAVSAVLLFLPRNISAVHPAVLQEYTDYFHYDIRF